MQIRNLPITDRTVILAVVAAYAAGAMIVLSVLIATTVWPAIAGTF